MWKVGHSLFPKESHTRSNQLEMITLDQLVPPNHLVRKMEAAIDFTFIYYMVKDIQKYGK
ncbi:hypothetical protein ABES08_18340 [Peribacillus simplex]|uniref:hypothetical protein n=1 Tax=Peribacillus simplex TaxID=1478 RepID=UPI003D2AFCDF